MTDQKDPSRFFWYVIVCSGCTILLLLLVEGLASFAYVTKLVFSSPVLPIQGTYTHFDSELGWVNIPNVYFENLFGPGVYFRSNSQGFRNNEDFPNEVPLGKFRIICSGDSFTMGLGVDNDHTWCQLLSRLDDRIQTVNMGETAYGIDQAYLWYSRDGVKLDLDLHILAFIDDDFARMTFASHWGYGKPVLVVEHDRLAIRNVPVPRYNPMVPALARSLHDLNELRTLRVLSHIFRRIDPTGGEQRYWRNKKLSALPVAFKIFESLHEMHAKANQLFVLVYLPTESECFSRSGENDQLRENLDAESRKMSFWFWDLTGDCQQLPGKTLTSMFFGPGQGANYHLTAEGNRTIANLIYHRMMETPEIATRLGRPRPLENATPAIR